MLIAFAGVAAFMIVSYGLFGLFAILALFVNLVLITAAMSIMQSTLTLPGIAGIVLTMGMSVDANVLINERIRDELRSGKSSILGHRDGVFARLHHHHRHQHDRAAGRASSCSGSAPGRCAASP